MKRKVFIISLMMLMGIATITGCGREKETADSDLQMDVIDTGNGEASSMGLDPDGMKTAESEEEPLVDAVPEISRIKAICELATLKCTYHNVAKSTKKAGTGLVHAFEKDRDFWIEYTGNVEISYKVEQIDMQQDGTEITITLPAPTVTCSVAPDSWNEDSQICAKDQIFQKNPITAADVTGAMKQAQENMEEDVRNNTTLLSTADLQAKNLVESYINQIGQLSKVQYHITWKELEENEPAPSKEPGQNL